MFTRLHLLTNIAVLEEKRRRNDGVQRVRPETPFLMAKIKLILIVNKTNILISEFSSGFFGWLVG